MSLPSQSSADDREPAAGRSDTAADQQQVARVQALFVQHVPALRGILCALLPGFSHLDDVIQETFLTVTRKADQFAPRANFLAWATGIARLKAIEAVRADGKLPRPLSDDVLDSLFASAPDFSVDEAAFDALARCLELLSPQSRRAVELRYIGGIKPPEIGQRMGWAVESVYVLLSRARAALRSCVEKRVSLASGGHNP